MVDTPLDETISAGQAGHVSDHQYVHKLHNFVESGDLRDELTARPDAALGTLWVPPGQKYHLAKYYDVPQGDASRAVTTDFSANFEQASVDAHAEAGGYLVGGGTEVLIPGGLFHARFKMRNNVHYKGVGMHGSVIKPPDASGNQTGYTIDTATTGGEHSGYALSDLQVLGRKAEGSTEGGIRFRPNIVETGAYHPAFGSRLHVQYVGGNGMFVGLGAIGGMFDDISMFEAGGYGLYVTQFSTDNYFSKLSIGGSFGLAGIYCGGNGNTFSQCQSWYNYHQNAGTGVYDGIGWDIVAYYTQLIGCISEDNPIGMRLFGQVTAHDFISAGDRIGVQTWLGAGGLDYINDANRNSVIHMTQMANDRYLPEVGFNFVHAPPRFGDFRLNLGKRVYPSPLEQQYVLGAPPGVLVQHPPGTSNVAAGYQGFKDQTYTGTDTLTNELSFQGEKAHQFFAASTLFFSIMDIDPLLGLNINCTLDLNILEIRMTAHSWVCAPGADLYIQFDSSTVQRTIGWSAIFNGGTAGIPAPNAVGISHYHFKQANYTQPFLNGGGGGPFWSLVSFR